MVRNTKRSGHAPRLLRNFRSLRVHDIFSNIPLLYSQLASYTSDVSNNEKTRTTRISCRSIHAWIARSYKNFGYFTLRNSQHLVEVLRSHHEGLICIRLPRAPHATAVVVEHQRAEAWDLYDAYLQRSGWLSLRIWINRPSRGWCKRCLSWRQLLQSSSSPCHLAWAKR